MSGLKIEIKNDKTRAVEAKVKEAVRVALLGCAETAVGYSVDIVPVDTGWLRINISKSYDDSEQTAYIGTNVEYAPYVEFGTSRMKPEPYLKPAVANHADEYKKYISQVLKAKVE